MGGYQPLALGLPTFLDTFECLYSGNFLRDDCDSWTNFCATCFSLEFPGFEAWAYIKRAWAFDLKGMVKSFMGLWFSLGVSRGLILGSKKTPF